MSPHRFITAGVWSGHEPGVPADAGLRQLLLPMRHGGFGLRCTSAAEANAALLTGVGAAHAVIVDGPEAFCRLDGPKGPELQRRWDNVLAACPDLVEEDRFRLDSDKARSQLFEVQHRAARMLADAAGGKLLQECDLTAPDGKHAAARLRSASGAAASAWLLALPGPHTAMGDHTFVTAGRHRLGLRVHSPVDLPTCNCTGDNVGRADHAMSCKQVAKGTQMRHDSTRDILRLVHSLAGLCSSSEPPFRQVTRAQAGEGLHRADMLTLLPGGRAIMIDVTVAHTGSVSVVSRAARVTGHAAQLAERRKLRDWERFVDKPQYEFVPFAIESHGQLGHRAKEYVRELGDIAASSGRISKSVFIMNAYKLISCALQKGNSCMYAQSLTAIARATGTHFQPGLDVPVERL